MCGLCPHQTMDKALSRLWLLSWQPLGANAMWFRSSLDDLSPTEGPFPPCRTQVSRTTATPRPRPCALTQWSLGVNNRSWQRYRVGEETVLMIILPHGCCSLTALELLRAWHLACTASLVPCSKPLRTLPLQRRKQPGGWWGVRGRGTSGITAASPLGA